jgi:SAM-dependent methyltransferase
MVTDSELLGKWKAAERQLNLRGWDFSGIDGQWSEPGPPWDYKAIVKAYLKDTDILLDMGTGGGEVLLTLGHPYENTYATEAYPPNFELCQSKLAPLGITMAQTYTDDKLPFEAETFDFIINRHESFDLSEVHRTLKPGGYFFTQQVSNENYYELMAFINDNKEMEYYERHTVEKYTEALARLGFKIIVKDEAVYPVRFYNIDAVIFVAKACVWNFPNFSVETHFEKLRTIYYEIEKNGYYQTTGGRFILASQKI